MNKWMAEHHSGGSDGGAATEASDDVRVQQLEAILLGGSSDPSERVAQEGAAMPEYDT